MNICEKLTVTKKSYSAAYLTHAHEHAQLILPLQGELSIQAGSASMTLNTQKLFFIPPGHDHTFRSPVQNEFLIVDIPKAFVPSSTLRKQAASYTFDHRWRGICQLLLYEIDQDGTQSEALQQLFPYVSFYLSQLAQPASVMFIHEHYDQPLTVQQLADIEHYNRSYYYDWFYRLTGLTPAAYIQEVRLAKAKELLRHTGLTLMQIAVQVGLEHQSSLTRLFRRKEQMTPGEYRLLARHPDRSVRAAHTGDSGTNPSDTR